MKLPVLDAFETRFTGDRVPLPTRMRTLDAMAMHNIQPVEFSTGFRYKFSLQLTQVQTVLSDKPEAVQRCANTFRRGLANYLYGPIIQELVPIIFDLSGSPYGEPEEVRRLSDLIDALKGDA